MRHSIAFIIALALTGCTAPPLSAQPPAPTTPAASAAPAAATVARGRLLFLRCAACHEVEERGITKAGPTLQGVFGRPAGVVAGYGYSAALKSARLTWDAATLDRWLERPTQVTPDTTMAFIGLPAADDRKALIAYLQTLK